MEKKSNSVRSKSSSSLKTEATAIRHVEKVVKKTLSPDTMRTILKSTPSPKSSRLRKPQKSLEGLFHNSQIFHTENSSPPLRCKKKARLKSNPKELTLRPGDFSSLKALISKTSKTPLFHQRATRISPMKETSLKRNLLFLPQPKLDKTSLKPRKNTLVQIKCVTATGSCNGKAKPNNQDSVILCKGLGRCKAQSFLGVMDGHGIYGHDVSGYLKKHLPLSLNKHLHAIEGTAKEDLGFRLKRSLQSAYHDVHRSLLTKNIIDISYSGSTAVTVIIREKYCVCANVGDSRAVIGRFNDVWTAVDLSVDHKPGIPEEKKRIEACGGRVEPYKDQAGGFIGPERVWMLKENYPGLAMSRSFGDLVAAYIGVTAEPDVVIHELKPEDKFLVIASDGVWEFISSQECVNLVAKFYEENSLDDACVGLKKEAIALWNKNSEIVDDISFIIAFLDVK